MHKDWEIQNTKIVSSEGFTKENIWILNDRIVSIGKNFNKEFSKNSPILDLEGTYTYPALINAHDHLIGSYSPPVLNGAPYLSWLSWDNILKSSVVFSERQTLEPLDLYLLGAYKNIFGGVTTVMDHIPHFIGSAYRDKVPVRVLSEYSLSHSIGSYSLGWGEGPALEYSYAVKKKIPYVTHIGEGIDDESKDSLRLLDKIGALGEYTVLVHGIPFGPKEVAKIKSSGASMVWCPISNYNLFRRMPPIHSFLDSGIPVSLGTDLSLSGSGTLFQEMKLAKKYFQEFFQKELSSKEIFLMTTIHPAKAFRIDTELGTISVGKKADLLVLKEKHSDPFENLIACDWEDIVLLTRDGAPILVDGKLEKFIFATGSKMAKIFSSSGICKWVTGDLKGLLKKISLILGYKKDLAFLPTFESIDTEA